MSNVTSQSELTTKEIVEQAISDYHESILPYLNGMVPTIANKFDKANLYSTGEQIVGRWMDGKPLYQKTILFTASGTGNEWYSDIATLSDIDKMVSCVGNGIETDAVYQLPNNACRFRFGTSGATTGLLRIALNGSWDFVSGSFVTLQYTKTTDEAIAIGSDTDYSLEEKIVGTWTDGKPLYQKTIEWTGFTNGAQEKTYNYDISSLSFEHIHLTEEELYFASANLVKLDAGWRTANDYSRILVDTNAKNLVLQVGSTTNNGISKAIVTLQYTKITDV